MPIRGSSEKSLRDNGARETTLVGYAPAPVPVLASVPLETAADHAAAFEPTIWAALPAVADEALAAKEATDATDSANISRAKVSGRPDRRNPLSRRQPINRGRHLSRQFFEEGERHQRTGWQTAQLAADDEPVDRSLQFESFDRVPSRRAPGVALTLLAGAAVIGLAAWGMGWPNFSLDRSAPTTEVASAVASVASHEVPAPAVAIEPAPMTDTEALSVEEELKPTVAPAVTRAAQVPVQSGDDKRPPRASFHRRRTGIPSAQGGQAATGASNPRRAVGRRARQTHGQQEHVPRCAASGGFSFGERADRGNPHRLP